VREDLGLEVQDSGVKVKHFGRGWIVFGQFVGALFALLPVLQGGLRALNGRHGA
jgi:hypothetical protein